MPSASPASTSSSSSTSASTAADIKRISLLTISTWVLSVLLLQALSHVAPFDSSHLLSASTGSGLRWDALHFTSIASRGYRYEQQLAFQPGWMGTLALLGRVGGRGGGAREAAEVERMLWGAVALNALLRVVANVALYKLTHHLAGRPLALIASILYALPPAPAVLVAPYTEAPFAALSFAALYLSATRRYLLAAICFALATSVRATGVLGAMVLGAHMVIRGDSASEAKERSLAVWIGRLPKAILYCIIIAAPFVGFQAYGYYSFCTPHTRPWCSLRLPLVYSFVQREYWNVGPFHYWVPEQIPSFVLAAPVLWVSVLGCAAYFRKRCGEMSDKLAGGVGAQQVLDAVGDLLAQPAFPIYVYQAVMLVLLVFASHTQIALRLSLTDPVLWWSLAGMFLDASGTGKGQDRKGPRWWVWWCLVWGGVSLVLWAGHYPPA